MKNNRLRRKRFIAYSIGIFLILGIIAVVFVRYQYDRGLKPVSSSYQSVVITIPEGSTLNQISKMLKDKGLIRSSLSFQEYVDSHNLRSQLEAGTYSLSPSQNVADIVAILTNGKVSSKLVTILPGSTISQIQSKLINSGFSPNEASNALVASNYSTLPVMSFRPSGYGLEGLIFPDSYAKDSSTSANDIVKEALTEMGKKLTPSLQSSYASEGLSVYQAITMASIIEKEVSSYSDQQQVARVFLNRIKTGMPLESNVTAIYAKAIGNQAYNTYNQPGLPPSPLCNVDSQVLKAVANPANSSHLYFVTGKDGITRFSDTIDQHNANIAQFGQSN